MVIILGFFVVKIPNERMIRGYSFPRPKLRHGFMHAVAPLVTPFRRAKNVKINSGRVVSDCVVFHFRHIYFHILRIILHVNVRGIELRNYIPIRTELFLHFFCHPHRFVCG